MFLAGLSRERPISSGEGERAKTPSLADAKSVKARVRLEDDSEQSLLHSDPEKSHHLHLSLTHDLAC